MNHLENIQVFYTGYKYKMQTLIAFCIVCVVVYLVFFRKKNVAVSDAKIKTLHPKIRVAATKFQNEAIKAGLPFRITEGLRTVERQNKLFEQGRTTPGAIVTNARGGQSWHNYGLAFDIIPIINGTATYKAPASVWANIATIGKKYGFEWGGNFAGLTDKPHFQKKYGLSTSKALAMYNQNPGQYITI